MNNKIQPIQILEVVSKHTGFTIDQIKSPSRKAELVKARHISMDLCRWNCKTSMLKIAIEHGRDNHATIIHACNCVHEYKRTSSSFRQLFETIENEIRSINA